MWNTVSKTVLIYIRILSYCFPMTTIISKIEDTPFS
jgi:hypothetical protein